MLNKVFLIGRLGSDPELRYTPSGTAVVVLNIATNEYSKDKNGNKQDKTEWHRVVVWSKKAESVEQYLSKGSLVYVEGCLRTRKWKDNQDQERYITEIVSKKILFLDSRKSEKKNESFIGDDGYSSLPDEAPF